MFWNCHNKIHETHENIAKKVRRASPSVNYQKWAFWMQRSRKTNISLKLMLVKLNKAIRENEMFNQ